jgi:asparagine synthase (glutamine-hydrolysing)
MNQEMHYRGPDDSGIWHDGKCGMAQVRLSIIGIEKGKQPLFNEDKSLVLICNGEIYNYIEIKEDLRKKGHIFNSDSDSETILHLYEEYGVKCLEHLRGMFAFCLWDIKKQQLFVARDRIGEKPLYYSQLPTGVVFSSELKAVLKSYIPNPRINIDQLLSPIRYTAPTSPQETHIEQIKRLPPGYYAIVNETGFYQQEYWQRRKPQVCTDSFETAKKTTLSLLKESVDLCMRSDVPVAVMLSGGIDSSAIAALAKETGKEVHVVTAGYTGEHDCDEREVAKRFAKQINVQYHEIEIDKKDYYDCFEEFTQYIDEPITDSAAIAQWGLYKKTKSLGFKVLLGGMGGDELFYGYPYWNQLADSLSLHRSHQDMFPWTGIDKKKAFVKFFAKNWKYVLFAGYPRKIEDRSICGWMHDDYHKFISTATYEGLDLDRYKQSFAFDTCKIGDELDLVYDFSFDNIMVRAYLYLTDRLGMGNSMEIRSPFLDYKLVDYVSSLPQSIKYTAGNPKSFLKEVLAGIVPDYILYAQKRGFTPPNEFVNKVVEEYRYNSFQAEHKFYNSVLADRILSLQFPSRK